MAYSYQSEVSDGTLQRVILSIPFYNKEDIHVSIDGQVLSEADGDYSWEGDVAVYLRDVVPAGQTCMLRRSTDMSKLRLKFSEGVAFTRNNLDDQNSQFLHMGQEAKESAISDVYNDIDMHQFRIRNAGDPVKDLDYTTKRWVDNTYAEAVEYCAASALAAGDSAADAIKAAAEATSSAEGALASAIRAEAAAGAVGPQVREALRRSYAEIGLNLVSGSFEEGAIITDPQEVLLQCGTGKCFNWQGAIPVGGKIIPIDSTPESTGGIGAGKWQDVTSTTQHSQAQYSDGVVYKTYYAWQGDVTLQHKDEAVQFKRGGMFYRWDGAFPQGGLSIPQNTPEPSAAQTGTGKYVAVLDLAVSGVVFDKLGEPEGYKLVGGAAAKTDIDVLSTRIERLSDGAKTCANIAHMLKAGQRPPIGFTGDSTMHGAQVGNLTEQSPTAPVITFRNVIWLLYGGDRIPTVNIAISGSTLKQMMEGTDGSGSTYAHKISPQGILANCHVVYCNHGINDSQLNGDIEEYRRNLHTFVNLTREAGKVPVLVTPNPNPAILIIDEEKSKRLETFVDAMRKVAQFHAVDLVDQYYYFMKTSQMVPLTELVPDGAHLTDRAYLQAGANLTIPLVSANTIYKVGDCAGLVNATYFDNCTKNRLMQSTASRTGMMFSAERQGSLTGINLAVLMDIPTDTISYLGLKWGNAAPCIPTLFGDGSDMGGIHNNGLTYGSTDWDSETKMSSCTMYAGLNVIGLLFDMSNTNPITNTLAFSGVRVPPKQFATLGGGYRYEGCGNYEALSVIINLPTTGSIVLVDYNDVPVLSLISAAGSLMARLHTASGNIDKQLTTTYRGEVSTFYYRQDGTNASVSFGVLGATFELTEPLPTLYMQNVGVPVTIAHG